ncbi:hypothetical protein ULG90_24965 [Halopseudomonas pachastrellae]|nr:hypothetical protein ULG90_24965 [Halopseudomonas pachastrellae]
MLSKYKLWLQACGLIALVLLGFGVGWSWQGANGEAALERANTAHANTLARLQGQGSVSCRNSRSCW